MSTSLTVTCDICGKQKKDVNHWWKFYASDSQLVINKFEAVSESSSLPYKDACGVACLQTAVSRWTAYGNFNVLREEVIE